MTENPDTGHTAQEGPGGPADPGEHEGHFPLLICAPLRIEARAVRRGLCDGAKAASGSVPGAGDNAKAGPDGIARADTGSAGTAGGSGQEGTGAGAAATADDDDAAAGEGARAAGGVSAHRVLRTGYGAARAASWASEIHHLPFGMLTIMGTGAGLAEDLKPGDLVVGTEITGAGITGMDGAGAEPPGSAGGGDDRAAVPCPSAPLLAGELRRAGLRVRTGTVVTVDHLVGRTEREKLARNGMAAADMESAPLAAAAGGRPVAVIRAVSDTGALLRPGTLAGGMSALRSLRAASGVLGRLAAACGPRRVLLAGPRSFCAGVERAIEIVERALEQRGSPVYVRKQIVHNTHVVADLERRGAIFVDELDEVPDGASVVFSAHGVSPAVRAEAAGRELSVVDATCPLVAKVHAEARRFAGEGYLVALIGHEGHEEVEGTIGEAPGSVVVVGNPGDVAGLRPRDAGKVAYLMQTTLAADEASGVVGTLLDRFPEARGPGSDDICYATTNRQRAVRAVAAESDLVLVAGSANSSNSRRLVETAERAGAPAHLIDGAGDIELGWLAGAATIGLTAGASAPPAVVEDIITALGGLGPVEVSERVTTTESLRFSLPKEVRQ